MLLMRKHAVALPARQCNNSGAEAGQNVPKHALLHAMATAMHMGFHNVRAAIKCTGSSLQVCHRSSGNFQRDVRGLYKRLWEQDLQLSCARCCGRLSPVFSVIV